MTLTSIGDLATQLIIRNRNTALRSELQTLTDELSTGVTHDVHARVGGDYSYLAQIDRDLERLEGYSLAAGETTVMFAAANQAVSRVTDLMVDLADDLIAPVQLTGATQGRLARRMDVPKFRMERFRTLNGLHPKDRLRAGRRIKLIQARRN